MPVPSTDFNLFKIQAGSLEVTAGSLTVIAGGYDTTGTQYQTGSAVLRESNWTPVSPVSATDVNNHIIEMGSNEITLGSLVCRMDGYITTSSLFKSGQGFIQTANWTQT